MDGPPGRKGCQCLFRAGSLLPSQQITGRDDLTVGAGAFTASCCKGAQVYLYFFSMHAPDLHLGKL
jgi:hypothetical protein